MKNNRKKGFSLAEMLIVFLLISTMLAAFAPIMTKQAKKKTDPSCPSGVKSLTAEYPIAGTYTFTAPENITGEVTVTIVGAGGRGADASSIEYNEETGTIISAVTGGGGGAGAFIQYKTTLASGDYGIIVGKGGGTPTAAGTYIINGEDSVFDSVSAKGGTDANLGVGGNGGISQVENSSSGQNGGSGGLNVVPGTGGGNPAFSTSILGGAPGAYCPEGSCDPHGKAGSGYEKSGLSATGFVAGLGGGGGGVDAASKTGGYGGVGGDGFVKVEYQIRCQ